MKVMYHPIEPQPEYLSHHKHTKPSKGKVPKVLSWLRRRMLKGAILPITLIYGTCKVILDGTFYILQLAVKTVILIAGLTYIMVYWDGWKVGCDDDGCVRCG
jgi:hypothetical protein